MTSHHAHILGSKVNVGCYSHVCAQVMLWAKEHASKYVCVATVNNIMEGYDSPEFRSVMNDADLVTSDGMPLVWALRALGHSNATRVYGPDLMPLLLERAENEQTPVGLFGGSPSTLNTLVGVISRRFPTLNVAFAYSPPYRPLTEEEDDGLVARINHSGTRILFIGLNTPKQDLWMAAHKGRVDAVMIGVGAAFDFVAGVKPQAPRWMMRVGMEWFFRLLTEPRRLWKRYLKHNPRFVGLFFLQLCGLRHFPSAGATSGRNDHRR